MIARPYKRIARPFNSQSYMDDGVWLYNLHPKYAKGRDHYIKAAELIIKDIRELFYYVQPADINTWTYSHRIHELLLRTCSEVEANLRAILTENGYTKVDERDKPLPLNMNDYVKVDRTHHLSSFKVEIPSWSGERHTRTPFETWASESVGSPEWYTKYHAVKHDRAMNFKDANFDNLIEAACGLLALLASQFMGCSPGNGESPILASVIPSDGTERTLDDHFRIYYPSDWSENEKYSFNWDTIKKDEDPFQQFDYTNTRKAK